jgi:hypothetical protein
MQTGSETVRLSGKTGSDRCSVKNGEIDDIGGYQLNSLNAGFCLYRKWLTHGQMVCIANAGNFRFLSASSKVTR